MKKIIIIASIILIFIIITFSLVLRKKSAINTSPNSPFPTGISLQESNQQNNRPLSSDSKGLLSKSEGLTETKNINQNLPNLSNLSSQSNSQIDISTITPIETKDFKLQYSSKLNKIVVERKTPQAEEQFTNWASQNKLSQLIENPGSTLVVDLGKNPDDFNPLLEFLNIFMNFGQGAESPSSTLQTDSTDSTDLSAEASAKVGSTAPNSFAYFPQCGDFGDTSLPNGCNLCQAGCGPTAVSMIATSYLGAGYDPKTIVNLYRTNKPESMLLGCDGSRYSDAKQILQSLGLKTTDYFIFNAEKADTVVPQLKKYFDAGWTFFALARFCDDPKKDYCGHFFWITDIDNQDNIWAYDPYYGRSEIPYNENSRYPYPLYLKVFGVKK